MSHPDSPSRDKSARTRLSRIYSTFVLTLLSITSLSFDAIAEEDPSLDELQRLDAQSTNQPRTFRNGPPLLVEWVVEWYDVTNDERCIDKLVDVRRLKEEATTIYFFDIDCDGKVETRYFQPDNMRAAAHLAIDFDGDDQIDVVLFDVNRDGHVDYSSFDVNDDGRGDLMGYHKDKQPVPYKIELSKK